MCCLLQMIMGADVLDQLQEEDRCADPSISDIHLSTMNDFSKSLTAPAFRLSIFMRELCLQRLRAPDTQP